MENSGHSDNPAETGPALPSEPDSQLRDPDNPDSFDDLPPSTSDDDIVEEPHKLFAAEARVVGLSRDQWRHRLGAAAVDWLGPRGGWILLAGAVLLWLWVTYTR